MLAHEREGASGSGDDVLFAHACLLTELHAPQVLDIVFDLLGTVIGFCCDLAGGFFLHQAFVANDALVDTEHQTRTAFEREGRATWCWGRGWDGAVRTGGAARHAGQG